MKSIRAEFWGCRPQNWEEIRKFFLWNILSSPSQVEEERFIPLHNGEGVHGFLLGKGWHLSFFQEDDYALIEVFVAKDGPDPWIVIMATNKFVGGGLSAHEFVQGRNPLDICDI